MVFSFQPIDYVESQIYAPKNKSHSSLHNIIVLRACRRPLRLGLNLIRPLAGMETVTINAICNFTRCLEEVEKYRDGYTGRPNSTSVLLLARSELKTPQRGAYPSW